MLYQQSSIICSVCTVSHFDDIAYKINIVFTNWDTAHIHHPPALSMFGHIDTPLILVPTRPGRESDGMRRMLRPRAYHISLSSALESTVLSSLPHSATLMADVCPFSSSLTGEREGGTGGTDGMDERRDGKETE